MSRPPAARRRRQAGFTFVELLVSLIIVILVVLGVLAVFDLSSRTARLQTHLAEMQQSQRVAQQALVRMARMAGRGGLPTIDGGNLLPAGLALAIQDNVGGGTPLLIGGDASAKALQGTDVLTVRGVFSTPIYQNSPTANTFSVAGDTGSLKLSNVTPTGAPQSLVPLRDAIQQVTAAAGGSHPEALLLVSPLGRWAVVEMVPGGSVDISGGDVTGVTIQFQVDNGVFTDSYRALSSGGVFNLQTVAYAGLLEEYQFYVRDVREVPSDPNSAVMPELARARLYPNTGVAYARDAANLREIVADNVLDLQLALGIDKTPGVPGAQPDERIDEGDGTTLAKSQDEWLYNDPADDDTEAAWNAGSSLYYLRINTLVRTDRPEPYYETAELTTIEDKDYSVSPYDQYNAEWQRRYHRRELRTVVDLRNL